MKKIISTLALLALSFIIVLPMVASADISDLPAQCTIKANTGITGCPAPGAGPASVSVYETTYGTVNGGTCCLFSTINQVVNWIFFILLIVAIIFILIGAFTFITASGSPEKAMAARNYLMFAAIGIAVALLARAVPAIVRSVTGVAV
jgi:hypothetical protein